MTTPRLIVTVPDHVATRALRHASRAGHEAMVSVRAGGDRLRAGDIVPRVALVRVEPVSAPTDYVILDIGEGDVIRPPIPTMCERGWGKASASPFAQMIRARMSDVPWDYAVVAEASVDSARREYDLHLGTMFTDGRPSWFADLRFSFREIDALEALIGKRADARLADVDPPSRRPGELPASRDFRCVIPSRLHTDDATRELAKREPRAEIRHVDESPLGGPGGWNLVGVDMAADGRPKTGIVTVPPRHAGTMFSSEYMSKWLGVVPEGVALVDQMDEIARKLLADRVAPPHVSDIERILGELIRSGVPAPEAARRVIHALGTGERINRIRACDACDNVGAFACPHAALPPAGANEIRLFWSEDDESMERVGEVVTDTVLELLDDITVRIPGPDGYDVDCEVVKTEIDERDRAVYTLIGEHEGRKVRVVAVDEEISNVDARRLVVESIAVGTPVRQRGQMIVDDPYAADWHPAPLPNDVRSWFESGPQVQHQTAIVTMQFSPKETARIDEALAAGKSVGVSIAGRASSPEIFGWASRPEPPGTLDRLGVARPELEAAFDSPKAIDPASQAATDYAFEVEGINPEYLNDDELRAAIQVESARAVVTVDRENKRALYPWAAESCAALRAEWTRRVKMRVADRARAALPPVQTDADPDVDNLCPEVEA